MSSPRFVRPVLALALLAGVVGIGQAQTFSLNWNPRSGDVWVDTQLADMNRYGARYQDPFIDEMVRYHGAPRDLVVDLLRERHWAPGDVYYACTIAEVIGRSCRYVSDYWQVNHAQGWGVVAKRLGVQPGSPAFRRLKNGFVPTYDRWARPIELDDDLRRAYPNYAKRVAPGRGAASDDKHSQGKAGKPAKDKDHGNGKGKGKH